MAIDKAKRDEWRALAERALCGGEWGWQPAFRANYSTAVLALPDEIGRLERERDDASAAAVAIQGGGREPFTGPMLLAAVRKCVEMKARDVTMHVTGGEAAALVAEFDRALSLLREVEWDRDTDRCPVCRRLDPSARQPFENEQEYGHAPSCRLAALLR
jgi:hypothetical protein